MPDNPTPLQRYFDADMPGEGRPVPFGWHFDQFDEKWYDRDGNLALGCADEADTHSLIAVLVEELGRRQCRVYFMVEYGWVVDQHDMDHHGGFVRNVAKASTLADALVDAAIEIGGQA